MTSALRASRVPAAVLAVIAALLPARSALAGPVVIPTATAPSPSGQGQGLCLASAISVSPAIDFSQTAALFNAGMNAFLDTHVADWTQGVQATVFDLSNGQDGNGGPTISWGDFTSSMVPACPMGGCPFPWNDTTTSFASRFRGYLNVTSSLAGTPLHVGIYTDDAASLTVFDATGTPYAVLTQPPVLGFPTWRMTETVTFGQAGLYPVEILYAQIVEHAALEVSFFQGSFQNFQQPANQVPITSLATAGFTLFAMTSFFQTESGAPSFSDPTLCQQCVRGAGSVDAGAGCPAGMICNAAALCAPCDVDAACGASCSPCASPTPYCVSEGSGFACAACRTSADCGGCACDPTTHACASCGGPDGGGPDGGGAGGTGGATTGHGGSPSTSTGTGGSPLADAGTAGAAPADPGSKGGCGCRAAGDPPLAPGLTAAAIAIAVVARRPRRRRPRHETHRRRTDRSC